MSIRPNLTNEIRKKQINIAQEIKEGLLEAIEFAKGNKTEGRVTYLYAGQEICLDGKNEVLKSLKAKSNAQSILG